MYKINKQLEYIVQHRKIEPLFCNNFQKSIIYKNVESLCCISEINMVNQLQLKKQGNKHQNMTHTPISIKPVTTMTSVTRVDIHFSDTDIF